MGTKPRKAKRQTAFFVNELRGETPLSRETAELLYELAAEFYVEKPWRYMSDDEMVLVTDEATGERCYCGTMGALGEVFAMRAFLGDQNYRAIREVAAGIEPDHGKFMAKQRAVELQFVENTELEKPDRELLRALRHPMGRGLSAPIFRAQREGFVPWYVTESEGLLLAHCLESFLAFIDHLRKLVKPPYWAKKDTYPLVVWDDEKPTSEIYRVVEVKVPIPEEVKPAAAEVDEAQILRIAQRDHPMGGILEVDHIFTLEPIGERYERKQWLHVGLCVEARTGFSYVPESGIAEHQAADTAAKALLHAIEARKMIPEEVCVKSEELRAWLSPVGEKLGFEVKVGATPNVDFAGKEMLRMLFEE